MMFRGAVLLILLPCLLLSCLILPKLVFAQQETAQTDSETVDACLLVAVMNARPEQTIGELKQKCAGKQTNRVKQRQVLEKEASKNPFAILPHKPNYLLPITLTSIRREPYQDVAVGPKLDNLEAKFQVSIKYLAWEDFVFNDVEVEFAFTATSWWQSYNDDISAPFRETNYEPELIFVYNHSWSLLGLPVEQTSLSFNHQSNGQTGLLSRSWNRIIAGLVFAQTDNVTWGIRGWYRIPEQEKLEPLSPEGDDNPNIERYVGYGELGGLWNISDKNTLELVIRNNLRSDNRGAVELGWSFPINGKLQGYLEYFNGYGESLIYFDQHTQRIGLGFKLTNWL
ncbi:phospholipase A [Paraglaciecola aquimarina]|uniref:Phospholipase A1 n=1 Tax=Paraglaciecola algarum TaxID=3050085 RepID=A0ABS9D6L8_9ALTE|nr:phospholipase A [Paraglaciecola sp. G1-23]MCF2948571.1 phospholipase A [Paraglaciecola sp. G1-23]